MVKEQSLTPYILVEPVGNVKQLSLQTLLHLRTLEKQVFATNGSMQSEQQGPGACRATRATWLVWRFFLLVN